MVPCAPREAEPRTRRSFLAGGALILASAVLRRDALSSPAAAGSDGTPALKIGLVTDVHYADKEAMGTRVYRESIVKMREAVSRFRKERCELAVELGDLVDGAETEAEEVGYLKRIEAEYATFTGERHHVLGNHCVWTLTKRQFLETVGQSASRSSADRAGFHLVFLDACFRKDGAPYGAKNFAWNDCEVPAEEREWLAADLRAASLPAVVFIHQRLDVEGDYAVRSAAAVREILERSEKVMAVFQGHFHENDHREVRGIHYVTLAALVEGSGAENNAYGVLELYGDASMKVRGFRRQKSLESGPRPVRRTVRV